MTRRTVIGLLSLPAAFAQSSIAGIYQGKWEGTSASGSFQMSLQQEAGEWKATVAFSIGGNDVPATVALLKISGEELEVKYVFELGGVKLQSHLQGAFRDGSFTGRYKTQTVADSSPVDEGSCSAKRT